MGHALQLLGPVRLRSDGRTVTLPPAGARLLAVLALGGPVGREQAAAVLWPESSSSRSMANLRTSLSRLNRAVPGVVEAVGNVLALSDDVSVDVDRARRWVTAAIYGDASGDDDDGPPPDVVRELLAGWDDPWVTDHREPWRVLVGQGLESAAAARLAVGRAAAALPYALAAVTVDPLAESAHRVLIEVHARRGDAAAALRQFERLTVMLRRELGVQPSPDIAGLIRRLYPFGTGRGAGRRSA
ncbi:AfsR/SARP family transcriptional regulator [Cellulomonas iranensis]|uniref:AfsR/SARP family transcriptional regulator n=1 Tax=Cellulomonas iranensis TaxID=76862 RepID=UPI000B3CE19F|nr:BTAD domain-containing putative transcriptional regulator [Cellulomonas iranensis]